MVLTVRLWQVLRIMKAGKGGRNRKSRIFVSDFETTVFKGQEFTEVWAAATVEMGTENVSIFHSLNDLFEYYVSLKCNVITYFHNLKFDGAFWLSYLMYDKKFEQAVDRFSDNEYDVEMLKTNCMKNNTYKYLISDMGQWYSITIRVHGKLIEIRDSLKLLPFSVERIGKGFKTRHQKLHMEYEGFRYAGCEITPEEREYIKNDVLVVKEALEIMYEQGHKKLTIGSCCLAEFRKSFIYDYDVFFPNLYDMELDGRTHDVNTIGDWIHKSYRGGWCYVVPEKSGKIMKNGLTADVNSLYPSMMSGESGNEFPVGTPNFWSGDRIPEEAVRPGRFFFVRVRCRFRIKPGYLPFIQLKGNLLYRGTESLTTSDVWDPKTKRYYDHYYRNGELVEAKVEMTFTQMDYYLFLEHYDVTDFEILDGCYFLSEKGLFDRYINKYKEQKINSTGAMRELAKLFLNNLYGKMASSMNSSFKYAFPKEDGSVGFVQIEEYNKKPGYIAIGSAITSYARCFTIRAAQANYYGPNKRGFIYADTDSIHCDLKPEELKNVPVHDTAFCCWKIESKWDEAIFTRQKTYIEHVTGEHPWHNIKCAGMPDKCKNLFALSMSGEADPKKEWTEEEYKFLFDENGQPIRRTYKDFTYGLCVPGKLLPKRIRGGIVLEETTYEMR